MKVILFSQTTLYPHWNNTALSCFMSYLNKIKHIASILRVTCFLKSPLKNKDLCKTTYQFDCSACKTLNITFRSKHLLIAHFNKHTTLLSQQVRCVKDLTFTQCKPLEPVIESVKEIITRWMLCLISKVLFMLYFFMYYKVSSNSVFTYGTPF